MTNRRNQLLDLSDKSNQIELTPFDKSIGISWQHYQRDRGHVKLWNNQQIHNSQSAIHNSDAACIKFKFATWVLCKCHQHFDLVKVPIICDDAMGVTRCTILWKGGGGDRWWISKVFEREQRVKRKRTCSDWSNPPSSIACLLWRCSIGIALQSTDA